MLAHTHIDIENRTNPVGFTHHQIEKMVNQRVKKINPRDRNEQVVMLIDFLQDPIPADVLYSKETKARLWREAELAELKHVLAAMFGFSLFQLRNLLCAKHGEKLKILVGDLRESYSLFVAHWQLGDRIVPVYVIGRTELKPSQLLRF